MGTNSLDTDPGYVTMPTSETIYTSENSISRSSEKVDEIHFSDEPHFQGVYYEIIFYETYFIFYKISLNYYYILVIPSPTTTPYVGLTF